MSHMPDILKPAFWLKYVVQHPRLVITFILFITLLFALQLPKLRFQTSIYDLAIEDLPETTQYHAFKKQFGCEEIILVVAKAGNIFDPKTFQELGRLAEAFSKIPGVRRVVSLPGIKKAMDITDKWGLSDFEGIIGPIGLFKKNLISEDGRTTVLSLILDDIEQKDTVIDGVQGLIASRDTLHSLYQIGMPNVSKALAQYTELDFFRLPPITFAIIALMLFLIFRTIRGILIPAGSVLIALIWTFGLMALTDTPLSMLSMIVPIFLIAVGTAYCMYVFPEYLTAAEKSQSPREAAYHCFLQLGFPTSLAVMTTTIGLGTLMVNRITAIREFALFSCFGILSMLLIMLTFLPAVMALLPLPTGKMGAVAIGKGFFDRVLEKIIDLNLNQQKPVLVVIAVLALAGLVGVSKVRVETNPVDFFKKDTAISQRFHDIYQDMAGSFPINVVVDSKEDGYFEAPQHLQDMASIQRSLDILEGVDKSVSFSDYLKLVNYATNQYGEKFYALPEEDFEVRMLVNSFKTILGQDMLVRFMDPAFSKANILLRTHISSSRDFLATKDKIENILHKALPKHFTFDVTGFGIVISQSSHLLSQGQIRSLGLTLVLVFAIMFLLFMSYKVGLIGIAPNCFPIIVNFGLMGWLGVSLSTATSLIASIAIGLAVDDTIHYLVRYNREFKRDLDKKRALRDTVLAVGKPIIFTTLTISLGFAILMFSNFKPTAVFGLMMVITMFSALVADLILLPSLMLHVELVTLWDLLSLKLGKAPQEGIPLFEGLSRTQVHYILIAGTLRRFEGSEVLFRKGEVSDSMYAIISGELEVVNLLDETVSDVTSSAKQLITRLKPGDVVGEMGMIRSCKRSATVITSGPVELLQINDRMIKRLQWLYPPTAQRFFFNLMAMLCNRLENLTESYLGSSSVDTLTGLYTRPHFMDVLEKEMARSLRYKEPASLMVMDLDDFKAVNRNYGHQKADLILAETGVLLKKYARKTDIISRYDGQQFAFLLPSSPLGKARTLGERIREKLAGHPFEINSHTIHITASFGIAAMAPGPYSSGRAFMDDALKALKEAKARGKNRVEAFKEQTNPLKSDGLTEYNDM